MAANEMIDIMDSSSDEDDEEGNQSPVLLSPPRGPPRTCHRSQNCKRPNARSETAGREEFNASSSPSLQPKVAGKTKSKEEKKRESLERARRWRDNRKRPADAHRRDVVNLASPLSPGPRRGQRTERQAGAATSPTPRKMSKAEKQQAKERARRWHENRRRGGARHRESSDEEETDSLTSSPDTSPRFDDNFRPPAVARASTAGAGGSIRREEVVNLLSPPSHQSTPWLSRRQARPSNAARSSSAAEIEQSLRRDTQQSRSFSMRATVTSAAGRTRETQREETQQWACPRCTLLNPHRQLVCEACHHVNVPRQQNFRRDANSGGDLVYDVDRNGNFIEEGDRNGQGRAQRPPAAAATMASRVGYEGSGVGGHVARSRSVLDNDGWGRPRGLYSSNAYRSFLASLNGPQMEASAMLHQYIHSMGHRNASLYPPGSRGGVDNMSYERLLEMFGDGSENRGASSEDISSLPVSKVGDPERDLPEDKRQCSICLDEFSRGDERTSLPCLHSFHSQCVNRWLSSNGTCPVCKTSVRENGRG